MNLLTYVVFLYDTLTSFYSYYKERKEEPKISIEKEEAVVYGDKRAIHRVFSNIIYNGLVHGSGNYKVDPRRCTR